MILWCRNEEHWNEYALHKDRDINTPANQYVPPFKSASPFFDCLAGEDYGLRRGIMRSNPHSELKQQINLVF